MRFVRVSAGLLAGVLVLAGCGTSGPPGDAARINADLVADLDEDDAQAVGEAVNTFGFELLDELTGGEETAVTSPLSVAVLLAMVLAGAEGDTAEAMADVLRLEDSRDVRVGALLRELADTEDVTLSVANALWANEDVPLEQDYQSFVEDTFGATLQQADLSAPESAEEIDDWAADNTEGHIDAIAEDLGLPDPNTVLVLLNAVYFLGEWTTQFDPDRTRDEPFTLAGGEEVDVSLMQLSEEEFGYAERDGYRMLRLPYGEDERYGMEVLLPDEPDGLADLLADVDAAEWRAAADDLAEQEMDEVALPRFELEWGAELNEPLQALGMEEAFSPAADFTAMSPADPFLDTVVHKTYIRVDEEGTEAAAVTGADMAVSAPLEPLVFRADHPFAFTVSDTQTGTILFLGAVADPRE